MNSATELAAGRIAVGMSGGVDSSVAAMLLQRAGHDVVGVFIRSWEDDGRCPAGADAVAAAAVAEHIGIELEVVDFTAVYRKQVFADFLAELRAGRTPNPDIWCNAVIKFAAFADHVLGPLGASRFATGHYARVNASGPCLFKSEDESKDQTYFLYRITRARLAQAVFPLGELRKAEVRQLAHAAGLPNADRPESMGICFIGPRDFRSFVTQFIPGQPGALIDDTGQAVGSHAGAHLYTIGQRQGLGLGGPGAPWYVASKDMTANTVTVVRGRDHPALLASGVHLTQCHWIAQRPPQTAWVYTCRYRHGMEPVPCTLVKVDAQTATVAFSAPQWGIAPGQAGVIYDGVHCLGGGTITAVPKL